MSDFDLQVNKYTDLMLIGFRLTLSLQLRGIDSSDESQTQAALHRSLAVRALMFFHVVHHLTKAQL